MNARRTILLLLMMLYGGFAQSQSLGTADFRQGGVKATPRLGVKSNLLWDATATANLGGELKLSDRLTLDIPFNYNAWSSNDRKKWKHLLVQPEMRWWLCESFYGHFFGLHGIWAHFNVGGIKHPFDLFPDSEKHRHEGDGYGAGLSWGYHWMLSPHWSLEFTAGAGYIRLKYDRYECGTCGRKVGEEDRHYFGPTKAGINLIYIIK